MSIQFEPGMAPEGFIPLSVPVIGGNEWRYVKECLDSGWVSSVGSFVERFEREIAAYVGAKYAVATVSGTAALHVALLVVGVEPEDEVIMPSLTFIAPANAVRYTGAWPVFLDVEPAYWQLDPIKVADFLERECEWRNGFLRNTQTGRRIRAILPVDILGHPCDFDPLTELASKYNLSVVEDATESLGATYKGQMAGALGEIGCLSFNGNKLITTGGGGMLVTNNDSMAERARYLTTQAKDDPIEYVHEAIGYNYRLTNVLAAIGCAQLERIREHIANKRSTAAHYRELLGSVPGIYTMSEAAWAHSTFWLSTVLVDEGEFGMDRRKLLQKLELSQIQARPIWEPLHLSRAHRGSASYGCEITERVWRQALSLPSSVGMTQSEVCRVTDAIKNASKNIG